MRQVWKFRLTSTSSGGILLSHGRISVPIGSTFLHCGIQAGYITAWLSVDPKERHTEPWAWRLVSTGEDYEPGNIKHFATIQDGPYVWHLFWERTS